MEILQGGPGLFDCMGNLFITAFSTQVAKEQECKKHQHDRQEDVRFHDVQQMESTPASTRQTMGSAGRQWLLRETGTHAWLQRFEEILATAVATA